MKKYRITVVGAGYVGLSLSVLLSQNNDVTVLDNNITKVEKINRREPIFEDDYIKDYFQSRKLNLVATENQDVAFRQPDFVVVAVPTNYDSQKKFFDTSIVESVIKKAIEINKNVNIVIKSTVPIGFCEKLRKELVFQNIFFSPEFLRETKALYDNLYPSRIIVGTDLKDKEQVKAAQTFIELLKQSAIKENIDTLVIGLTEAEAVKLFANTYLAMRVSFFNELDTYAETNSLNTKSIIDGVCLDPRIGNYYNNPSFGYGGYCLPKDSKQLLANYKDIPQNLISSIVNSNETRKDYIAEKILNKLGYKKNSKECNNLTVGVYCLAMKANSDNFRSSAVQDVIKRLKEAGVKILIYEPALQGTLFDSLIINDFNDFVDKSDIIITNRMFPELKKYAEKVYTRDIFNTD